MSPVPIRDGSESAGQRFRGDHRDVRCPTLPVPKEIERLGARVLRAVAADRPLAGDAGVKDLQLGVLAPEGREVAPTLRSTKTSRSLILSSGSGSRVMMMSGLIV